MCELSCQRVALREPYHAAKPKDWQNTASKSELRSPPVAAGSKHSQLPPGQTHPVFVGDEPSQLPPVANPSSCRRWQAQPVSAGSEPSQALLVANTVTSAGCEPNQLSPWMSPASRTGGKQSQLPPEANPTRRRRGRKARPVAAGHTRRVPESSLDRARLAARSGMRRRSGCVRKQVRGLAPEPRRRTPGTSDTSRCWAWAGVAC